MKIIVSILFLVSSILCQINEEYIYKTKFRGINAGKTKISLSKQIESHQMPTIITIESYSNRFIDMIYKLRHFSTIIVHPIDYSLLATTKNWLAIFPL